MIGFQDSLRHYLDAEAIDSHSRWFSPRGCQMIFYATLRFHWLIYIVIDWYCSCITAYLATIAIAYDYWYWLNILITPILINTLYWLITLLMSILFITLMPTFLPLPLMPPPAAKPISFSAAGFSAYFLLPPPAIGQLSSAGTYLYCRRGLGFFFAIYWCHWLLAIADIDYAITDNIYAIDDGSRYLRFSLDDAERLSFRWW